MQLALRNRLTLFILPFCTGSQCKKTNKCSSLYNSVGFLYKMAVFTEWALLYNNSTYFSEPPFCKGCQCRKTNKCSSFIILLASCTKWQCLQSGNNSTHFSEALFSHFINEANAARLKVFFLNNSVGFLYKMAVFTEQEQQYAFL